MSEFKIETGIPVKKNKYPFPEMDVGQSFFIATDLEARKIRRAATAYGSRTGKKFSTRKIKGGYRCWRIA